MINKLTICDIEPLHLRISIAVFVLEFDVRLPGNIVGVYGDDVVLAVQKRKSVSEDALGNQAAGPRHLGGLRAHRDVCAPELCARVKVRVRNDRGAGGIDISDGAVFAHELLGILRLDVAAMVLVEVIKLVIDVNWRFHVFGDYQGEFTGSRIGAAVIVVFCELDLLNLVAHHIEDNTEAKEDQAEDRKNDHRGTKTRDWAPGWQHLLLEPRCAKLFNLLFDLLSLFFGDIHNLFKFNK